MRRPPVRRILELLALSLVLAAAVNAVSPRGISWRRPLGDALQAQAAEAGLVPVDLAAAIVRIKDRSLILVDARTPEDFEIGHFPGALNVPWKLIEEGQIPAGLPAPEQPLLVYCANEFCESSLLLGKWLRARGHRDVALFVDGYEAWWNAVGIHEPR